MSWQRGQRDLTALKVGSAVLVGLAVIVFGLLWGQDLLRRSGSVERTVLFDSGFGLKTGDPVLVAGVKKGQVIRITLTRVNRVAVDMRLDEDVRLDSKSQFIIESEGLIGARYINVISNPGGMSLAESDTLQGLNAAGLNDVFRGVQILLNQIGQLTGSVQGILTDSTLQSQLGRTYDNFNTMIDQLNRVVVDNQDLIRESLENLSTVVSTVNTALTENMDDLETALQSISGAGSRISLAAASFDSLSGVLTAISHRFGEGEGTLWQMAESDALYRQLVSTFARIDSLIVDIRNNPMKYFSIRIF